MTVLIKDLHSMILKSVNYSMNMVQASIENGPQTFKKELQNIINQAVHKNRVARLLGPLIDATQWKLNFETAELANIRTSKTDEDVNDNPVCKSNKSREPVCGSKCAYPQNSRELNALMIRCRLYNLFDRNQVYRIYS